MNIPKTLDWCAGTGSGKLYESSLEFQPDTNYSDLAISTPDTEDYCSLKYDLVDLLSALLISKHDDENGKLLGALVVKCIEKDPEFMLKVALYFRRLLDIGKISNLLISGSCFYAHCQVFINKYFDVCICSPSDWIEIAECYSLLSGDYELKEMPKALRKCMVSKFLEFDQYQLAQCKQKLGAGGSFKPKICSRSSGGTMMSVLADTFLSRVSDSSPTLFTLKDLIRKLHISKPAFNVMCALGKVYPKDTTAFAKMGLEGDWDASKAGLRMKLPVHSKWKVRSAADKSPHSWTKAIMSGALSHELILQNLKSIICSSISQNGHGIVLQRLSNPELVIEGKQLPVAYITAYMTVEKLHDILSKNTYSKRFKDARLQESEKIRCKYLFKSKKPRVRFWKLSEELLNKYLLALTKAMSLSVRHNLPPIRCSLLVICSFCSGFDLQKPRRSSRVKNLVNLLSFICGAICSALCENSVIFVVLNNKYDVVSIDRMLLLLYGSLYHTEENKKHSSLFISPNVPLIDKIKLIYKNRKYLESYPLSSTLDKFIAFRKKFDKIVVFGDCPDSIAKYVLNHRVNIGPIKAVWSNLSGSDKWCTSFSMNGWIESKGLVDSVFKYLSLPDDKCLVEQIDKIDETYKLNALSYLQMDISNKHEKDNKFYQIKSTQCNFCRVYISSSYADMHSERDLICQKLAPNLFQNVAIASNNNICLDLVDLRFGVSDAAARSLKALEMYLKQAAASDIFVLLLGDTYGWIPEEALVKALPDSLLTEVNRFYKPGMSIMEMEYHMAKLGAVNNVSESSTDMFRSRLFVFNRDFDSSKIPNEHKHTFRDQDPASVRHLNVFKQLLLNDGVFIHNYSVQFAGVIDNYPVLENLDNFASRFLSTLESSVMKLYHTPVTESTKLPMDSSSSELMNISTFFANYVNPIGNEIGPRHLIYLQHTFKSMIGQRNSNLPVSEHTKCDESSSDTHQKMKTEITSSKYQKNNGGILIITGNPGSGKTVHLAALAMSLDKGTQQSTVISSPAISTTTTNNTQKSILSTSNSLAQYQILIHFTNGIPSTGLPSCKQLSKMLDHWIKSLIVHLQSFSNSSNILKMFLSKIKVHFASANTANDFHNLKLKMLCLNKMITFLGCIPELHYAFLIDDVDYLDPLLLHDWLPSVIPKNIQFIFTCHSKSEIIHKLTYQYSTCSVYQIPQLTPEESRAVILTHLHCNGVPFVNSQLECEIAALISASELNNPLYFSMACKCLQLCRTVDEVKSHLKTLPSTSHLLIEQIVKNLQSEYKSVTVATLGFLIFCRHSLSIKELLILLNEWLFITSSSTTTTTTTTPCGLDEKLDITWENQPWKMLSTIKDKPNDFESICALESNIEKFILSKLSNNNLCGVYTKSKQQFCLSPLKFHILLNELQPLLAIFNRSLNCLNAAITNNLTLLSDKMVTLKHKISLWSLGAGKLSFLSHSIKESVFDIFFKNQESYMYSTYTFQTTIHKILAIALSDLDDKLYHFLYADELDIICHLLTSPTFICKILSNHPSTLIKFLNGYPTNNPGIQGKWKRKMKSCTFGDKIDAMKKFILMNYEFLVKYPNSFCELAINQDSSEWIHTLGLCLLYLSNSHLQLSQPNLNYSPILFRLNSSKRMLISPVQQNISYKPIVTSLGSMDVPTSVEVYSTANLLVYGTKCGTIAFVEMSSMHELGSLSAHHASVQSLCFLDDFSAKSENIKVPLIPVSQLWLMSASEDGDVFIWDVSRFLRIIESNTLYEGATTSQLASLCGYHRRCVITSAWHPRRQLAATGGLDCMVYLWDISELGTNCTQLSSLSSLTNVDSVKLHPFKSIDVSTYPVVSVAFRLPYLSEEEQDELMHDILAIGCWDGTIYFYNLSSLSVVRSLSASSSLCSLAYSPNGGKLLATLDRNGQLMLWNDDILWYEGGLIQEYSCFVTDYFPCNQADVLIPNQYGRICFSKPNGQYIFQSGGGQYLNNYINIWDVNLWAVYSPWISVKQPSEISSGGPIYITYTTVLSTYQHVFIGWSNGDLTVVHIYDGQLLHHMKAPTDDNSSIQCISSSAGRSYSQFDAHHITFGYSSGAVRIYLCIFKPKISSYKDRYVYQAEYATSELHFQLIDTLWSHSINHDVNGIGENGGTLCTDSYFCVAITGGGNAEVWVNFIGRRTGSKIKKSICLKEHNSEVIAISAESKFFATASKSRQIALYKYDSRERTITLWHLINDVTTAAISSFSLLRVFIGTKTISISVYIGDSNSKLYNYSITKDGFELRQTLSANTFPIKFMWHTSSHFLTASENGEFSVWKCDKHGVLQFSHRLGVSADLQSMNSNNNIDILEKSFHFTSFLVFADCDFSFELERKIFNPTETLNKLVTSDDNDDNIDSESNVRDPDSIVTTLSGEEMSSSASYHTGSEKELYECGYQLLNSCYTDDQTEMDPLVICDDSRNEQFHLLNSCKKGYIVYRENSYNATDRILCGAKVTYQKSSDQTEIVQDFCYRIFAPNILQYRGTLKGHSGLALCTLTSTCESNANEEDCKVVSAASAQTVSDVGCDIRLWSMPSINKLLKYHPNQHSGPITCLGQLRITDHFSICISGCIDGSVMFWSEKNSAALNSELVSATDLIRNGSLQWKPLVHLFCSKIRPKYTVSDIATQIYVMDESKPLVQYLIYITYGQYLWRMRIILDQSNMSADDIQNTFERLFSTHGRTGLCFLELDVFWSSEVDIVCSEIGSFIASHPIVKICPRYHKPNQLEQCEVVAVLVNGEVIIATSNERETFSFDQGVVRNGLWCSSIGTSNSGIFAAHSGMAFICKHADESRTFQRIPGYIGSCEKDMWINSVSAIHTEGDRSLYLAECHLNDCWKILICSENGDLLTEFTLENSSIKVTAYCAKLIPTTSLVYLVIATSDNILRVLQCPINISTSKISKQWKQVSVYPVDAEITQLYTLQDTELKILAGDLQGQINYYALF